MKTIEGEKKTMKKIMLFVLALCLCFTAIGAAFARDWKDFEDAVQYTVAESNGVDCIITRNKGDFEEDAIPCYTPQEFIRKYTEGA